MGSMKWKAGDADSHGCKFGQTPYSLYVGRSSSSHLIDFVELFADQAADDRIKPVLYFFSGLFGILNFGRATRKVMALSIGIYLSFGICYLEFICHLGFVCYLRFVIWNLFVI